MAAGSESTPPNMASAADSSVPWVTRSDHASSGPTGKAHGERAFLWDPICSVGIGDGNASTLSLNSTRIAFRVHSWLGLATGAVLLVIALTGAYLVFDTELDRLFNPEIRSRPPA